MWEERDRESKQAVSDITPPILAEIYLLQYCFFFIFYYCIFIFYEFETPLIRVSDMLSIMLISVADVAIN